MSDNTKRNFELLALLASLLLAGAAFGKAWFTLPYRIEVAETAIAAQQQAKAADHELLVRIDERLKDVQRNMDKLSQAARP